MRINHLREWGCCVYSAGATMKFCGENTITTTKLLSFRLQKSKVGKEVHKYLYIFHLTCKSLREISWVETSLEDCETLNNPLINCVNDIHFYIWTWPIVFYHFTETHRHLPSLSIWPTVLFLRLHEGLMTQSCEKSVNFFAGFRKIMMTAVENDDSCGPFFQKQCF